MINPERVRHLTNPFRVLSRLDLLIPGFSLCSNRGLKLTNAFGVHVQTKRLLISSTYKQFIQNYLDLKMQLL